MANQLDIKELAARGAAVRLAELQAEIDAIKAAFPTLGRQAGAGGGRGARKRSNGAMAASAGGDTPSRRRRTMSAAEKRAVSIRMKKYWAGRRKAKAAAAK